jgi:hypothetical protein
MSRFVDCEGGNMLTTENLRVRKSGTVPNECREEGRVERKFRGKPHIKGNENPGYLG